ncbi:uncharacterized protein LOC108086877 [Drosophila ficusphila]|uniref:uncharacterized protein LOC108086877 n=1 Tax=Drosophila ficusphila TaxID=30025 RepID=UPI0007E63CAB|nr:uncharacterized protein LOC108086877 [Drosophila ficusphila]
MTQWWVVRGVSSATETAFHLYALLPQFVHGVRRAVHTVDEVLHRLSRLLLPLQELVHPVMLGLVPSKSIDKGSAQLQPTVDSGLSHMDPIPLLGSAGEENVEMSQNLLPWTLVLSLQEFNSENEILHRIPLVVSTERDVTPIHLWITAAAPSAHTPTWASDARQDTLRPCGPRRASLAHGCPAACAARSPADNPDCCWSTPTLSLLFAVALAEPVEADDTVCFRDGTLLLLR